MSQMQIEHSTGGMESAVEALPNIEHPRISEGVFDYELTSTYHLHGQIEVAHDNVSWTLEMPEKVAYDGLAVFISGYGAIKRTSRPMRESLARRGVPTVTYSPARKNKIAPAKKIKDAQRIHVETISQVIEDIKDVPYFARMAPETDLDKIMLVTHSMGGLSAPRFAEQNPDRSDGIVNIAAAGYGSPTLREIFADVPKGIIGSIYHEILPARNRGYIDMKSADLLQMARHIAASPSQTIGEAISCLVDDVRPTVERVRKSGVKVGYIALQHDILVRPNPEVSLHVDAYTLLDGCGHIAPQKKPDVIAHEVLAMHQDLTGRVTMPKSADIIDLPVTQQQ